MLGTLTVPRSTEAIGRAVGRWHTRLQYAVALSSLAGVGLLCAIMLSKRFFLGSDSANDYAHVWFISDQIFHHARLPLHVATLESGDALTFPYAIVPWLVAAVPYALLGDWSVTAAMIAGFVVYGYAAVRARPSLRDPRLLSLVYINTFLIEGLVSFQMAFIWAAAFFLLFVEAVDHRRWALCAIFAVLAFTTHPFAGGAAVAGYALFAAARRPRELLPLCVAMAAAALVVAPFLLYIHSAPAVQTTKQKDLLGTLRFIARYRGLVIGMPLLVSVFAPAFRSMYLVVFVAMALTFAVRIEGKKVNTFGIARNSHPFYGRFIDSPQFDHGRRYRVLEPNDREDGAYQLMKHGAVLTQEFFDQSQFRRWWNSPEQYTCFLGAKNVDVVLLEYDYTMKFSQNEDKRLTELESAGKTHVIFEQAGPGHHYAFKAFDVRGARQNGARIEDCKL